MAEQMDWSKMLGAGYFRDRTVLITGASSGIGRDIAMSLSRMGAGRDAGQAQGTPG